MMKRPVLFVALVTLLSLGPARASAERAAAPVEKTVAKSRVVLADVVPNAPAELGQTDLGPAPAPGSSRLVHRDDIVKALPESVNPSSLKLPQVVRVVRATTKLSVRELEALAAGALNQKPLARGAKLVAVRPSAALTIPAGYTEVRAELAKPPRKAGKLKTTATVTFLEAGAQLAQLSVPVEIELPASAAQPDFRKGTQVKLVVRRGPIEIQALTAVSVDSDVGDVVNVTVTESGKVLRAKLVSKDPPLAEEAQ